MTKSHYSIKVEGILDPAWRDWFDGMSIVADNQYNTLLTGDVVDQEALHGLLKKIRDLGLTILVVERVDEVH